jgi:hypothetical protein
MADRNTYSRATSASAKCLIEKLRSHRLPDIDQIAAKLIKGGGRNICYEIHKLIISIWNKEELPEE